MHHLSFPPFRLDPASEQLWRGAALLPLRPKAFLLLRYLAEHPERLVTREELLKVVWQHNFVSDGLLRGYIRDLRQVLGDDAKAPRFIETARGRGYRFVAPVTPTVPGPISSGGPAPLQPPYGFVGRQEELAQLHGTLECALRGERQMVFVTGEPGIGKTALLDTFLAQVVGAENLWVGRGQCNEHLGAGEAYLPLLEALGGLARRTEGRSLIPLLRRQAPTWLVQMPALIEEAELDLLSRWGHGATPEQMGRQLSEALEALTAESPLILWLEDLHWGDPSTVDLLAMLARRRAPARLLMVGTYRPADVIASAHPLRALVRELEAHTQCRGLPLGYLTPPEVTRYLVVRFAPPDSQAARLDEWGRFIHRHTEGNPFFMVAMVDDLMRRSVIGGPALETRWPAPPDGMAGSLPESLRQLVDHQLERLTEEERRMLEAASVAGLEFSAKWVAAAMDTDVLELEGCCEDLARRHLFLCAPKDPAAPKRRLTERYRFLHALYPQILYQGLPAARRRRLHRRVGESKETAFGSRSAEIAAELAVHFEEARDAPRAVHYLGQAAQNMLRRSAGREAADLLTRALEQLQTLHETPERAQQELSLQASLGVALLMSPGHTVPEVKHAYDRAHALSAQASPHIFPSVFGLFRFELARGELGTARSIAEQLLRLAQAQLDPFLVPAAQGALGAALFHLGEPAAARAHVEEGLRVYDRHPQEALLLQLGEDPGVVCLRYAGFALQVLGYPDQALARSQKARALAEALSHSFSLVGEVCSSAFLYRLRRDVQAVLAQAEIALALVSEHALPVWGELAALARGWALAEQGQAEEGIAQMRHALGLMHTVGFYRSGPQHLVLPAEAYGRAGQANEGFGTLEEALATALRTGERWYEAELYRLKGELMLQQPGSGVPSPEREAEAEACFLRAVDIAHSQEARLFELRGAISLARLQQRQGKKEGAYPQLAEVYGWFTEGFETKDLQEAQALLKTSG